MDSKLTQRILIQARKQQQELEDEVGTSEANKQQARTSLGEEHSDQSDVSDTEADGADYGNPVSLVKTQFWLFLLITLIIILSK